MTLIEFIKGISTGGWLSVFIVGCMLVEITPIKINPIAWFGKHLNADMNKKVDKIEKKVDEHIAESYRNNIFTVQDRLLKGDRFTQEEWKKALKSCSAYKTYVKENKLENELAEEAIKFIRHRYGLALEQADFIGLGLIDDGKEN